MTKKVLKKKVLNCLWARKIVDICILRPATLPQVITDVVKVVDIGILIPAIISQAIAEVVDLVQV